MGKWLRMMDRGQILAAILFALFAYLNTIGLPESQAYFRLDYALFGVEFYLSASALLIISGSLVRDKGIRVFDLVLVKPVNRWRLLWDRLAPALGLYALVALIIVAALHFTFHPLPVAKAVLIFISTGLYLGLIGFTIANIARNSLAGIGGGIIFWIFEAAFNGRLTAPFYLLITSQQVDQSAGVVWQNPTAWLSAKMGIILISGWLFLLNGWLLDDGPARRRAIAGICVSLPVIYLLGWWLIPKLILS
jgi:hypothetical protein